MYLTLLGLTVRHQAGLVICRQWSACQRPEFINEDYAKTRVKLRRTVIGAGRSEGQWRWGWRHDARQRIQGGDAG